MKPLVRIRQREHSLELLYRLARGATPSPVSAPEILLDLQWSPEWLDEQIAAIRRRGIKVRLGAGETLCIATACWARAARLAEKYALVMSYPLRHSRRRANANAARPGIAGVSRTPSGLGFDA